MSNLRHLIRGISQLDVKPKSLDTDVSKYDKYIARMKAPLSLAESIATAYKLVNWMTAYQLGNPSEPWLVSRRLVRYDMPPNARIAGLELYKACVQSRNELPAILRLMFFKDIENEFSKEDFDYQVQAFIALSKEGRDVSGFDQDICPVIARWIDRGLANLDARKQPLRRTLPLNLHTRHLELRTVIALIKNIMKYNFSILSESDIATIVEKIVMCCKRTGDAEDIHEALSFFDTIVRYGYIPVIILKEVVSVLCSVFHGLSSFHSVALSVMQNLLRSHMSQGTLQTLRGIVLGWYNVHDDVILGALAMLTTRWTDSGSDFSTYTFTVEALFYTYREGLNNLRSRADRDYTALDTGFLASLLQILSKDGIMRAISYDDWHIPMDIVLICSRSLKTASISESTDPAQNDVSAVSGRLKLELTEIYAQVFSLLESLAANSHVHLPLDRLAEVWSALSYAIPSSSSQRLLEYHINELSCYPSNPDWLHNMARIGKLLYQDQNQSQSVRTNFVRHIAGIAALVAGTVLEDALQIAILELFGGLGTETHLQSSVEAVSLICDIANNGAHDRSVFATNSLCELLRTDHTRIGQNMSQPLRVKQNSTDSANQFNHSTATGATQVKDSVEVEFNDQSDRETGLSIVGNVALKGLIDVFFHHFRTGNLHDLKRIFSLLVDNLSDVHTHVQARLEILNLLSRLRSDSEFELYLDVEGEDTASDLYVSHDQYGGIRSQFSCKNGPEDNFLPLQIYFHALTILIFEDPNRQVNIAAINAVKTQLSNKQLFVASSDQILSLRRIVCERLTMIKPYQSMASDMGPDDMLVSMVYIVGMLIGYHALFKKAQEDEIVATLQNVLMRHQRATAACIHTLTICAYEMPLSTSKNLPSILLRLSQLVTSTNASVHILEYLSALAKLPDQYVNFREEDYRRVFGISLQHIQYTNATARDAIAAEQPDPLANPMSAYVLALAYDTVYAWFLAIKLSQRPRYLKWIIDGLLAANPQAKFLDERCQVCYDFLARFCYSNSEIKSGSSVLRDFEADQSSVKSWLHGNSIVTMKTMNLSGLTEITVRRPSGSTSFLCKPNSDLEALSILSSSDAKNIVSSDTLVGPTELKIRNVISGLEATAFTPSHMLLQTSIAPELYDNIKPLLLLEDDTTRRAIATLDRIPVVDFHKIGVIYVGRGQVKQSEILSNTYGSPEYVDFLQCLGDLVRLRDNSSIYTGGLDTRQGEDGEFAYAYREKITQIIFHTCTLMPNRPEEDPESNRKKSHIGNDFVNIIWNSSNRPYDPQTIPSDFNFVNIVVSPDAYQATRPLQSDRAQIREAYYKVRVLSNPELPKIGPVTDWRLISASKVSEFVRTIAIHCNIYAQIHHAHGTYTSMWSQRLERIQTLKDRTLARSNDVVDSDEPRSSGYDFTAYN